MTLLDAETYQAITGDDTTPTGAQLQVAENRVRDYLHRVGIPAGTYTERLFIHRGGVVYPSATPITNAGDATVDGPAVYISGAATAFVSPWQTPGFSLIDAYTPDGRAAYGELTYAGGWTLANAPQSVLDALAWETWRSAHPDKVPQPGPNASVAIGATSVATGDVSVSYGANGQGGIGIAAGTDVMVSTAAALRGFIHRELTP